MESYSGIKLPRLILKIVIFLIIINSLCVITTFYPIGKFSLYNHVFPGRKRLPFGENPSESYNLTINNLDAMLASHEITGNPKEDDEFRVILIGDSSIWGFLQKPEETLAGLLNSEIEKCGEKRVEVFNLGYPSLSILKDLLFVDKAMAYEPDLILWFVTLESLNKNEQLLTPLVSNNPGEVNYINQKYDLDFEPSNFSIWDRTLIKQRRNFADFLRLQLYGVKWSATGIDQEYPETYTPALRDFELDFSYKDYPENELNESDLALDVIGNAQNKISPVKIVLVNEPILISEGINSDVRYNYYYPRWAYDRYREIIKSFTINNDIEYYDFWNIIPEFNFTNSAIHLNEAGEKELADKITFIIEVHCESIE